MEVGLSPPCSPADVTTFSGVYKLPVGPYTGACSPAQVHEAVKVCIDPSTRQPNPCKAWQSDPSNSACLGCWAGSMLNMKWSPVVVLTADGTEYLANVGGCVALADPTQLECAQAIEFSNQCDVQACLTACPVVGNDAMPLDGCLTEANAPPADGSAGGGCSVYATKAATCASNIEASGMSAASFCFHIDPSIPASFQSDDLSRFLILACGASPLPPEGGPPPFDAGPIRDALPPWKGD